MAEDLNLFVLSGRLADAPEHKFTPSGVAVATFRIACNRRSTTQGENGPTDWFTIVAWRNEADNAKSYLEKGQHVTVTGRVQFRDYQPENGPKKQFTEVQATSIIYGARPKDSQNNGQRPQSQQQRSAQEHSRPAAAPTPSYAGGGFDDDMDDPFADN